jgi:hypothetical protein
VAGGDQIHAGRLTPATQGFAGQAGSIRVRVDVDANGQAGTVGFDVINAPDQGGPLGPVCAKRWWTETCTST